MLTVYGIPNCTSVKKARLWLETHQIAYAFHDFKKHGVSSETLQNWLKTIPLSVLINKKGTTWRSLSAQEQAMAEQIDSAIELMQCHTSVIKRPVIVNEQNAWVGYDELLLGNLPSSKAATL